MGRRFTIDLVEAMMDFDLMPEYLLEVREHLDLISGGLLEMERLPEADASRTTVLQALFRSFHTVKGLSAMVEQKAIEDLAHRCESLLRLRAVPHDMLGGEMMDVLITATGVMSDRMQMLETLGNRAADEVIAFPEELLDRLNKLLARVKEEDTSASDGAPLDRDVFSGLPEHIVRKLTKTDAARLEQGVEEGQQIYIGHFSPTREILREGISIALVLQRIGESGRLIRNIPVTTTGQPGDAGVHVTFVLIFLSDLPLTELNMRIGIPAFRIGIPAFRIGIPAFRISLANDRSTLDSPEPGKPRSTLSPVNAAAKENTTAERTASREDNDPPVVIRINLHKMDEIMRLTGELMITKSRLLSGLQRLEATGSERELASALSEDGQRLDRGLRILREAILETRLVPIREVFHRLPLVLRDIMRESGKKVRLVFEGEHIELDRMIVERLVDPLIHIVRNAFDHGVESVEQRLLMKKDPVATIRIGATRVGNHVLLQIQDDGAGIDVSAVAAKAREMGIEVPDNGAFSLNDALRCLCRPGFSTQSRATRISGRGVGMDVVTHNVSSLNGMLSLDSVLGEWTCFSMQIPITLSITDAMLVRAAGQTYAIPFGVVSETIAISPSDVSRIERNRVARYRESAVPVIALEELYDLPGVCCWEKERPALLTSLGKDRILVSVDALVGKQEIVIKALEDPLVRVAGVIGAAELGDGQVVLILDLPGMLAQKWRGNHGS